MSSDGRDKDTELLASGYDGVLVILIQRRAQ